MRITRLFAVVAIATLGLTTPRVSAAKLADTKILTADAVKSLLASTGSVQIAQGKARTAARFGRPTKVYADRILTDTLTFLSVDGLVALQGGLPIIVGGKVIGAVGVSGATSAQDEQVAATAIAAVIRP
jgi:uncharacterized protein GlcG (DUF336 family)